ncbi:Testis expressed 12 [Podarcis lilfordi]|nr:Testis expressed 12 [Podarcis lilfordi]
MTSNPVKSDENRKKRKKEEKNESSEYPQMSSFEKMDLSLSESSQAVLKTEALEKVLNDTSKEINILLSKYVHILRQRAAMDASYVEELGGILKEAGSIEYHLRLKWENLKHRIAAMTGPLQSENGLSSK